MAAAARLGLRTAWISAVPDNAWGLRVRRELSGHGVDCGYVVTKAGARMGVYFVEHGAPPRPTRVLYDRRDSAFARLAPEEVDWEPVRRARLVHLTGITPALGASPRALVERALREAPAVSFDVNYRATLWSPAEARAFLADVLPVVRYLFLGQAEARTIFELTGSAGADRRGPGRDGAEGDHQPAARGGRLAHPRRRPALRAGRAPDRQRGGPDRRRRRLGGRLPLGRR